MIQYMLMFSLGPVQPFIEQARKTRDLWLGSFLLSNLMAAAMKNIEELGGQFVFPGHKEVNNRYANLPNKYIAIFSDAAAAEKAAEKSKKQIYEYWNALRNDVWKEIVQWYADQETDKIWEGQSNPDACFEIRWVVVEGDPKQYAEWLQQTRDIFEARKQLHNFQQREEPGEKSTISGERQALHRALNKHESERAQVRAFWKILTTRENHSQRKKSLSAKEISLDGSERLDAIDTIKRFATTSKQSIPGTPFPSTSSIATASFVEGLFSPELKQTSLLPWITATNGKLREIPDGTTSAIPLLETRARKDDEILRRDGDCYFRATFTPQRLEKDYGITNKEEARKIAKAGNDGLEKLLEATDGLGIHRPTPYYAVLKMDGDHMGKFLSTAGSQPNHMNISGSLSKFTRDDVPNIVNSLYPGRLVYAGGDDVLAFAPLARNILKQDNDNPETIKTVIDLANQLRQQYQERMKSGQENTQHSATASISIAIAHHFTPLSFVLRVMRQGERQLAKDRYGRNALVVSVIRRSGAQTQVGCHWEYETLTDSDAQPMKLFSRFYDLFDRDILSSKCVHILLEEVAVLVKLEQKAQASEIKRILLRQRNGSKKSELLDEEVSHLATRIALLAAAMDIKHDFTNRSTELEYNGPRYGLVEVLGWLLVMVFLTRKEED